MDSYEQSTAGGGETMKVVLEDLRCSSCMVLQEECPPGFLTCNIHGLAVFLGEICGLSIYLEPGVWVMTAAGVYIGGTLET